MIASIDEKISGLNAKKQKPDITPEETALLNSQISELNGAKTDANTQKNDIAAQVLQINNEKAQLDSLVVTESKIKAQSTIKIDAGGKIYGYGLAVEESGGTNYSNFIIRSDSFALAAPYVQGQAENPTSYPFIYRLTPFTDPITGTVFPVGAYMKSASMDYQSVKTSHIEDLAVDTAKIAKLAVKSGNIDDLAVTTLKIQDEAVTVPVGINFPSEFVTRKAILGSTREQTYVGEALINLFERELGDAMSLTTNRSGGKMLINGGMHVDAKLWANYYNGQDYPDVDQTRLYISVYVNGSLIGRASYPRTGTTDGFTVFFQGYYQLPHVVVEAGVGLTSVVVKVGFGCANNITTLSLRNDVASQHIGFMSRSMTVMELKK